MLRTKIKFNRLMRVSIKSSNFSSEVKRLNELYCRNLVRNQDYESFLIGLLWPRKYQPAYFAIKAFNIEIATIREQVPKNVNNFARIRFQFWSDLLQEIQQHQRVQPHINQPVALELLDCIQKNNLTVRWLERNVEARYADVTNNCQYDDYTGLEDYAEFSHSSIIYLLLELLGYREESPLMYAASHVGVANGLTTLLRGHPYHASTGICYFPRHLKQQFKVTDSMVLKGPQSVEDAEAIRSVSHDIASQAFAHMKAAREQFSKSDRKDQKKAFKALLSAIPSNLYLEELQKQSFDPYLTATEFSQKSPLILQYRLVKSSLTSSF